MKLVIKHSSTSGPLAIDELLLYPAVQPLWGQYYQSLEAEGDGINLTNGIVVINQLLNGIWVKAEFKCD